MSWAEAFRTVSRIAGTPVDLIIESDHFPATTLPTYTGPDVHVYSIEDIVVDVNFECGTLVGTDAIDMEFSRAEVAEATPTNLRHAVEAGGHLPAIVRWSRSQPLGTDPLPWHAETIPAATLAPGWPGAASDTHAIAFATTTPPAPRFEGLTQTIARVNNIESVLAAIAQPKAQTSTSIVQLTSSVMALVQHFGLTNALPPAPPPAPPPQTHAAIAAAPAPAGELTVATASDAVMDDTAAGASAEAAAAGPSWYGLMTPASTGGLTHTGATPSTEMGLNDGSMPVPDEAPVSRRTRLSLALASVLPAAPGTTQGTVEGPATWSAVTQHVMWADEHEWDDEYYASTDDERDDSHYVLFDDNDGDGAIDDDDGTSQHDDKNSDEYEARLNGIVPPSAHFCCRPVFS